jgi:hypothetical protein
VLAEIMAALKAIPVIVSTLKEVSEGIKQLRLNMIEREMEKIKGEVNSTLDKITKAETKEERRKLSKELAERLSK